MAKRKRQSRRAKGAGSIYQRDGRWYYQNKNLGIVPTSLRLPKDASRSDAEAKAAELYGKLTSATSDAEAAESAARQVLTAESRLRELRKAGERIRLDEVWVRYLTAIETGKTSARGKDVADGTLNGYRIAFNGFAEAMKAAGRVYVDEVTRGDAATYFAKIRKDKSDSTYNHYTAGCKAVVKQVTGSHGFLNAVSPIKPKHIEAKREAVAFTLAELQTIHANAPEADALDGWIKPAVYVMLYTGARPSDALTLKVTDVDAESGFIRYTEGKTQRAATDYAPEAMAAVRDWLDARPDRESDYLFPAPAAALLGIGRKVDKAGPGKQFQRFLKRIKITRAGLTLKSVRKSAAVLTAIAAGNRGAAVHLLGHSSQTVTDRHYLKDDQAALDAEAKARHIAMPNIDATQKGESTGKPAKTAEARLAKIAELLTGIADLNDRERAILEVLK